MSDYISQINNNKELDIYSKERIKKELVEISLKELEKSDDKNKSYGALLKEVKLFKKTATKIFRLYMRKLIHIVETSKYKEGGYKTKEEFLLKELKMAKTTYYEQKRVYDYYFDKVRPGVLQINDEDFEYSKAKLSIPYLRNLPEDKMRKAQEIILNEMPKRNKIQMQEFIKERFSSEANFKSDEINKYISLKYTKKQKEADNLFGEIKEKQKHPLVKYLEEIFEMKEPILTKEFIENETDIKLIKYYLDKIRDKLNNFEKRYL